MLPRNVGLKTSVREDLKNLCAGPGCGYCE